jgi:agmatinase
MEYGDISDSFAYDMTWAGQMSFGRLPATRNLDEVDIAIIGIPFDLGTTNRPGARFGPRAIREQSTLTAEFPSELWPWGTSVFERHRVVDYFDIGFNPGYTNHMLEMVGHHAGLILDAGANIVAMGGDHLVAYPLLRATAAKYGPLSLIHFDAHSDTWDADGQLNHGTMFLKAAEEGLILPERSVQVGMRTPNESHGFNVIHANTFFEIGIAETLRRIHEIVGEHAAYLTFDIDFLDPAYAPGTGTPVIGGATTWQARELLFGLDGLNIVGADLVEVAPAYDAVTGITALAGATLLHDELYLVGNARERRHRDEK